VSENEVCGREEMRSIRAGGKSVGAAQAAMRGLGGSKGVRCLSEDRAVRRSHRKS